MSTNTLSDARTWAFLSRTGRPARFGAILLLGVSAAAAAEVQFLPEAEVSVYRDGNVLNVGQQTVSDEVAEVSVDLAWLATGPGTSFRFSYSPYRETYNDLSDLDNTGHRVSLVLSRELSRKSTFGIDLYASRTERQRFSFDRPQDAASFVPRSTQDRANLDLRGRVGTGQRSFVDWSAGASLVRFERPAMGVLRDSDAVGGSIGWGRRISQQSELGVRVGAGHLSFKDDASTDTQSLGVFVSRQFGRNLTGSIEAAAVRSKTDDRTTTDPAFELSLTRAVEEASTLTLGARQEVSSGTGLSSATLDRGVFVAWRPGRSPRVEASIGASYWRREDLQPVMGTGSELETLQTSESLAWTPGRGHYALGVFHSYRDQNNIRGTSSFLDTSYHSGGVFFRWARRGR